MDTAACGTASESETDGTPQGHTRREPRHGSSTITEPTGFQPTAGWWERRRSWRMRCERICPQQRGLSLRRPVAQPDGMAEETKSPAFDDRMRHQLLHQRILVLDGPLDDDNGMLLTAQLTSLAADDPTSDVVLW